MDVCGRHGMRTSLSTDRETQGEGDPLSLETCVLQQATVTGVKVESKVRLL